MPSGQTRGQMPQAVHLSYINLGRKLRQAPVLLFMVVPGFTVIGIFIIMLFVILSLPAGRQAERKIFNAPRENKMISPCLHIIDLSACGLKMTEIRLTFIGPLYGFNVFRY